MVFFNYSTMQMAAKVVYYGPGLGGKTSNLHWIYANTENESRGEMVSLETETDRTLFFDLLPIEVGSIAGFKTRLQLYTVPGQVFYNTTRKLVLKGVDGVVFVADSQRAMVQANLDSFRNLEENLEEMGLSVDTIPLALQYNKRDLGDIASIEELNKTLNRKNWPYFEATAINGEGVFETLKGVSKLTLMALKKRLSRSSDSISPAAPTAPPIITTATPEQAAAAAQTAKINAAARARQKTANAPPQPDLASKPTPLPKAALAPKPTLAPKPAPALAPEPSLKPAAAKPIAPKPAPLARPHRKELDALGELERLRQETIRPRARVRPTSNGSGQLYRDIQLSLKGTDFQRARRFFLNLQIQDDDNQIVESIKDFEVEIDNTGDLKKVQLKLNIALNRLP